MALMETYLQRFLTLGRPQQARAKPPARKPLELAAVVDDVLPLVRPACEHAHIDLQFDRPRESLVVEGDSSAIGQLLINLLLNAIEAASAIRVRRELEHAHDGENANGRGIVRVEIIREPDGRIACRVSDSGRGRTPRLVRGSANRLSPTNRTAPASD